jgi:ParB-like chromosome segregation protein Spo0J
MNSRRFTGSPHRRWRAAFPGCEINCTVFDDMDADQAELAEIDENLIRADLTPAEEAIHIGRRKAIYEKLHPETVHGAVGRRGKRLQHAISFEPADVFIDDAAKKTGKHRATISRKATRAKKVSVLPDIIGTVLDNGAEIDALAKLTVEKQQSLAQAAKRGEQVSAIPRDHNLQDTQMVDASEEIEQSGCNYPEASHLHVESGDACEVNDEMLSPQHDAAMPDADARWLSQNQAVKAKQAALAQEQDDICRRYVDLRLRIEEVDQEARRVNEAKPSSLDNNWPLLSNTESVARAAGLSIMANLELPASERDVRTLSPPSVPFAVQVANMIQIGAPPQGAQSGFAEQRHRNYQRYVAGEIARRLLNH